MTDSEKQYLVEKKIMRIPLTRGLYATIDVDDYKQLSEFKWHAVFSSNQWRAKTTINNKSISMHRILLNYSKETIDHINGNGLDNRRENLRLCTHAQNNQNKGLTKQNKSGYKGVYLDGKYISANITHNGKQYYLGIFKTKIEAAKAYDKAAKKYHGEFAWLNFPEEADCEG